MTTRSPSLRCVTPSPSCATSPAISWPRIWGGRPYLNFPETTSRSVLHTPAERTFTSTSPGPGQGVGTSLISILFMPVQTAAFM